MKNRLKRLDDILGWLPAYLGWILSAYRKEISQKKIKDVIFLFADHFEPAWNGASKEEEKRRTDLWCEGYPQAIDGVFDSDGLPPQHTWFYPYDELNLECLHKLSGLCFAGLGEIELQLHHFDDTSKGLRAKLADALEKYRQVGALVSLGSTLKSNFGFVHGNWALDNSLPGLCGVNDELSILKESGCYADFTFPAPNRAQPEEVNSIFYAIDNPVKPKSYNTGKVLKKNGKNEGDLLIFQGPLIVDLKSGLIRPRIEDGEIASHKPFTESRVEKWFKAGIHVSGHPDWIFIKVFTHGAMPDNAELLLGKNGQTIYQQIVERLERLGLRVHFATARQGYNIAMAAAAGREGNPNDYRDYLIKPYLNSKIKCSQLYLPLQADGTVLELEFPNRSDRIKVELKGYPVRKIEGALQYLKIIITSDNQARIEAKASGKVVYEVVAGKELENLSPDDIISRTLSKERLEYKLQTIASSDGLHKLEFKVR